LGKINFLNFFSFLIQFDDWQDWKTFCSKLLYQNILQIECYFQ
jgi:hypothetical protein